MSEEMDLESNEEVEEQEEEGDDDSLFMAAPLPSTPKTPTINFSNTTSSGPPTTLQTLDFYNDPREPCSEEDRERLLRLLEILYTRQVFQEFRRPVLANHPHLAQSYLEIVPQPLDLGTLYAKVYRGYTGIDGVRQGLQRICENTLLYNQGIAAMEATARHLDHMAKDIFDELFHEKNLSYHTEKTSVLLKTNNPVLESVYDRRIKRFQLLHNNPLNVSELHDLLNTFVGIRESLDEDGDAMHQALVECVHTLITVTQNVLKRVRAVVTELGDEILQIDKVEGSTSGGRESITVIDLFAQPIYQLRLALTVKKASTPKTPSASTSANTRSAILDLFHTKSIATPLVPSPLSLSHLSSDTLHALTYFEREISLYTIRVIERIYRGNVYSTFWSLPHQDFVWTQLGKDSKGRNPWWPCIVLISHSKEYVMDRDSMLCNIKRIPSETIKGLLKFRPRLNPAKGGTSTVEGESVDISPSKSPNTNTSPTGSVEEGPVITAYYEPLSSYTGDYYIQDEASKSASKGKPTQPVPRSFTVPENYLLIEYFGQHDLGWKSASQVMRIEGIGMNYPGVGPSKIANNDVLAEFEAAYAQRTQRLTYFGQETGETVDSTPIGISMPSIEEIEEGLVLPENIKKLLAKRNGTTLTQSNSKKGGQKTSGQTDAHPVEERESGRKKNPKAKKSDVVDIHGNVLTHVPGASKLKAKEWKALLGQIEKAVSAGGQSFTVSKLPLPVQVEPDIIAPGQYSKQGLNVRRNAVVRARALVQYLHKTKPMCFDEEQGAQHDAAMALMSVANGGSLLLSGSKRGRESAERGKDSLTELALQMALARSREREYELEREIAEGEREIEETGGTDRDSMMTTTGLPTGSGKKKRQSIASVTATALLQHLTTPGSQSSSRYPHSDSISPSFLDQDGQSVHSGNGSLPSLPPAGGMMRVNFLERGASLFSSGVGLFHRRNITLSDTIFDKEHPNTEERVKLLKKELSSINRQIQELQFEIDTFQMMKAKGVTSLSDERDRESEREADENERERDNESVASRSSSRATGSQVNTTSLSPPVPVAAKSLPQALSKILPGKVGLLAKMTQGKIPVPMSSPGEGEGEIVGDGIAAMGKGKGKGKGKEKTPKEEKEKKPREPKVPKEPKEPKEEGEKKPKKRRLDKTAAAEAAAALAMSSPVSATEEYSQ